MGRHCEAYGKRIWQQIGNSIARATTTRLQCDQMRHGRKWFRIIGFATSVSVAAMQRRSKESRFES
jgi:hypothetical protein